MWHEALCNTISIHLWGKNKGFYFKNDRNFEQKIATLARLIKNHILPYSFKWEPNFVNASEHKHQSSQYPILPQKEPMCNKKLHDDVNAGTYKHAFTNVSDTNIANNLNNLDKKTIDLSSKNVAYSQLPKFKLHIQASLTKKHLSKT